MARLRMSAAQSLIPGMVTAAADGAYCPTSHNKQLRARGRTMSSNLKGPMFRSQEIGHPEIGSWFDNDLSTRTAVLPAESFAIVSQIQKRDTGDIPFHPFTRDSNDGIHAVWKVSATLTNNDDHRNRAHRSIFKSPECNMEFLSLSRLQTPSARARQLTRVTG